MSRGIMTNGITTSEENYYFSKGYQQGRADTIDECIKIIGNETCIYSCEEEDCVWCEIKQMEQLKEKSR